MVDLNILRARKVNAYRRLFLDGNGQLTADAEIVLDDLFQFARFFKNVPAEPQALAVVEGSRQVVRHILKRIRITEQESKRQLKGEFYDE